MAKALAAKFPVPVIDGLLAATAQVSTTTLGVLEIDREP